jgi:hypothetical protein
MSKPILFFFVQWDKLSLDTVSGAMEVIIFCEYRFVEINMKNSKVVCVISFQVYCVYGRKVIVFTNLKNYF